MSPAMLRLASMPATLATVIAVLGVACGGPAPTPTPTATPLPPATPTPTVVSTPTAEPTPTPVVRATPTPTPMPTPTPTPFPGATVISLEATQDATLYEQQAGSLANGSGERIFIGVTNGRLIRRALVAFDVAGSVPAGATVASARLVLGFTRTIVDDQPSEVHRVTAGWGEGTSVARPGEGGGTVAVEGDATWVHRMWPSELWASPGGDFSSTVSATATIGQDRLIGAISITWGSTAEMIADVQGWLDDPETNFGWIVLGNEEDSPTAKRFSSRENPEEADRPTLVIEYFPA